MAPALLNLTPQERTLLQEAIVTTVAAHGDGICLVDLIDRVSKDPQVRQLAAKRGWDLEPIQQHYLAYNRSGKETVEGALYKSLWDFFNKFTMQEQFARSSSRRVRVSPICDATLACMGINPRDRIIADHSPLNPWIKIAVQLGPARIVVLDIAPITDTLENNIETTSDGIGHAAHPCAHDTRKYPMLGI